MGGTERKVAWGRRLMPVLLAVLLLAAGCSAANDEAKSGEAADAVAPQAGAAAAKSEVAGASSTSADAKGQASGAAQTQEKLLAGAAAPGMTPLAGAADAEGLNRKLIYKANLTMKVKDYTKAQADIRDLTSQAGGYVLQFTENSSTKEQGGHFVLKIPSSGFSSFLKELEKIPHTSPQRNMQTQDVSEEYVDLEARLKAKQVLEARYLEFMQKASKTDELVAFTNELGKIQEEIERIKGRMRYIDQNVAFSTVEIRLYQPDGVLAETPDEGDGGVLDRAGHAMAVSLRFLSTFAQGLFVTVAAVLPVGAVAVLIGIPVWMGLRRARTKREKLQEAEKTRRLEYNRRLAGEARDRQDSGESDSERQGIGE
ncbi:DUF4349 domain-containing protein [Gorillibacterium sp. sgz5001074]|uniref:DUF4349 domain-containing protein n=1 Tax=Gorillibacterium sp. sgz5001074 TaxID=3446695 RepID=UPI003F679F76